MSTMNVMVSGTQFGKRTLSRVLNEYFNSPDRKLCDIIEETYPDFSYTTKNLIMEMCESAIPLMIKLDSIKN